MEFKYIQSNGDTTCEYELILEEDYTLKELIFIIFEREEWGYINLGVNQEVRRIYEYEGDKMLTKIDYVTLSRVISKDKKHKASGGWTRMDYYFEIA